LSETRTKTVFGAGPADARIVFIGEAPGREEDLQGLPFVGRAGQLLTKILASIGMGRDEVYIANILKCRPPENRDPQEEEVRSCEIYLWRQLELIDPVLICALGRIAGQNLLRCTASLSVLRENLHFYNDTKVLVTYHPAALLRNPNLKRSAWEDIKMVRRIYDEALTGG
jgi:DNA polymerase